MDRFALLLKDCFASLLVNCFAIILSDGAADLLRDVQTVILNAYRDSCLTHLDISVLMITIISHYCHYCLTSSGIS